MMKVSISLSKRFTLNRLSISLISRTEESVLHPLTPDADSSAIITMNWLKSKLANPFTWFPCEFHCAINLRKRLSISIDSLIKKCRLAWYIQTLDSGLKSAGNCDLYSNSIEQK